MTTRGYFLFMTFQAVGFSCVVFAVTVWSLSGEWDVLRLSMLVLNVGAVWLYWFNWRRMRQLHRNWLTKRDELRRRLRHAEERGDLMDIALTRNLMTIWNVEP